MLDKIHRFLVTAEKLLLTLMFFTMLAVAAIQIVMRNVFGSGLLWGDDLIQVTVLWTGFFAASFAARRGKHINIDVISRFLPYHLSNLAYRLVFLCTTILCSLAAYFSYQFILLEMEDNAIAFLDVPVWVTESIIPLAFLVIAWRYLLLAVEPSKAKEPTQKPTIKSDIK